MLLWQLRAQLEVLDRQLGEIQPGAADPAAGIAGLVRVCCTLAGMCLICLNGEASVQLTPANRPEVHARRLQWLAVECCM